MDRVNETINLCFARVTPQGLRLEERVYSNAKMIKLKWFEYARVNGEWDIPVLYNPNNPQKLILFDLNSMEVASSIELSPPENTIELEAYFAALNELKAQFFSKK